MIHRAGPWRRLALLLAFALSCPVAARAGSVDFRATSLEGDTLQLASFRGRVVIVDFWASWCPPCREELGRLAALEKELPGLVVMAVNLDSRRDNVEKYARRVTLPRRVVLDPKGTIAALYGVQGMPWTVLLDTRGAIVSARGGWGANELPRLRREVQRLLARGAAD